MLQQQINTALYPICTGRRVMKVIEPIIETEEFPSAKARWRGVCPKGHHLELTAFKPNTSYEDLIPKDKGPSPSIRNSKLAK